MFTVYRFYFLILFLFFSGEVRTLNKRSIVLRDDCQKFYIEMVVSLLEVKNNSYNIKVIWESAPYNEGDWIGIFQTDPKTGKVKIDPLEVLPVTDKNGWTFTSIFHTYTQPEKLGFKGKCLNYYAGYFDKCHTCFAVTCLRIEPDWMANLRDQIGPKKIKEVIIPGTYESVCSAELLKKDLRFKDLVTQEERILGQLIYGSRYLHVSVSYYPQEINKWWATHKLVKLCPLEVIFKDIRNFIQNTEEIVILDIKSFDNGFVDARTHRSFIHYLNIKFGDLAARKTFNWDSTFNRVWRSGKRLIIAYNKPLLRSSFLWSSVPHKQYIGTDLKKLHYFLSKLFKSPPRVAWALVTHVVLNTFDSEVNEVHGSILISEVFNFQITKWYKKREWLSKSNIVSVDFLKNTGIVRSAIQWNSGQCK